MPEKFAILFLKMFDNEGEEQSVPNQQLCNSLTHPRQSASVFRYHLATVQV